MWCCLLFRFFKVDIFPLVVFGFPLVTREVVTLVLFRDYLQGDGALLDLPVDELEVVAVGLAFNNPRVVISHLRGLKEGNAVHGFVLVLPDGAS